MIIFMIMMLTTTIQARSERCSLHAVALLDPIWIDKWHQLFPAHWKVGPAPVIRDISCHPEQQKQQLHRT